jgi:hypothetical protein
MALSGKLQIKPGQSAAVLNPPAGLVLPGVPVAASAADGTWSALRFRPAAG